MVYQTLSIVIYPLCMSLLHYGKLRYGRNLQLPWQRCAARLDDVVTTTWGGGRGEKCLFRQSHQTARFCTSPSLPHKHSFGLSHKLILKESVTIKPLN